MKKLNIKREPEGEIAIRIAEMEHPIMECRLRWLDFHFRQWQERWPDMVLGLKAGTPKTLWVEACWSVQGRERGLRAEAGSPTATDA